MTALLAIGFAAIEVEAAHRALRAGDEPRRRHHGGWAVTLLGVALFCFLSQATFG